MSHWPVDDRAAARLTTGMIARMTGPDPLPRAEALRQSQIALMQDAQSPASAHPRLWAPFVVVGEGWPTEQSAADAGRYAIAVEVR